VLDVSHAWVLVEYDELLESEEEGAGKLREWFAGPGARKMDGGQLPGVHKRQWGRGFVVRPAPDPQASDCTQRPAANHTRCLLATLAVLYDLYDNS
jgi:hypothetical protein